MKRRHGTANEASVGLLLLGERLRGSPPHVIILKLPFARLTEAPLIIPTSLRFIVF